LPSTGITSGLDALIAKAAALGALEIDEAANGITYLGADPFASEEGEEGAASGDA
jgi:hypothetical protein